MDVQAADLGELPPLSTRTRKRQERRDRVYDAAIALFVEHGFDQTSMDDIAARADLGRTTVFNHFPRKAAFLEEWALRRRQRAAAALGDPDHDPDHVGHSLREVLEGSDVRSILAGHVHFSTSGSFAGIPVSVASATCYTQDLTGQARGTRPQDGNQSYNLVHVYDDLVLHAVVPVAAGVTMSSTSAEESADVLAAHGVTVPEAVNPHLPSRRFDRVDEELEAMTRPIPIIRP